MSEKRNALLKNFAADLRKHLFARDLPDETAFLSQFDEVVARLLDIETVCDTSYDETVEIVSGLPATWYPAILATLVHAAYAKKVFVPGGASKLVKSYENSPTAAASGHAGSGSPPPSSGDASACHTPGQTGSGSGVGAPSNTVDPT